MNTHNKVLLISMPFAPLFRPSIGLGLLQAKAKSLGIDCSTIYFSLEFGARTSTGAYLRISESFPEAIDLAGEWVFREALFGPDAERDAAFLSGVIARHTPARDRGFREQFPHSKDPCASFIDELAVARSLSSAFLDHCAEVIAQHSPRLVGFSSTFQQHFASLALSQRLRRRLPDTVQIIGGANVEGEMGFETIKQFPHLDAAVSGEADDVFPAILARVLAGADLNGIPGVVTPQEVAGTKPLVSARSVQNLDTLPYPDYGDYFEQFRSIAPRLDQVFIPHLPFETSRGCWWGEHSHCTFCGLNAHSMAFRSKSADRALAEFDHLVASYPGCPIAAVDNIIDYRYFQDFVPALARREKKIELFYEVKANLKKSQVKLLKQAGITTIQPGIESLSSEVLKLMGKGVKAIANVQLLKFCAELGVTPRWNMLWGFPNEPAAAFQQMCARIPHLSHLPPPDGGGPIRLDRFSPNFNQSEQRGFSDVRPAKSYRTLYPLPEAAVGRLAYYFDYSYAVDYDVALQAAPLEAAIAAWRACHCQTSLFLHEVDGVLLVWDLRPGATASLKLATAEERRLLLDAACIIPEHEFQLANHSKQALTKTLERLRGEGLLYKEGRMWLALPLALGEWFPPEPALDRFIQEVRALGQPCEAGYEIEVNLDRPPPCYQRRCPERGRRLTAGHFEWTDEGRLRVHTRALTSLADSRLRWALSGLSGAIAQ